MRILHVIDNLKLGGTQNLAWRTWKGLVDQGLDVRLCVLIDTSTDHQWEWLPKDTIRFGVHGDYRKPGAVRSWSKRLAREIAAESPDVLHSWLWTSDVVTAGAAAMTGVPHLVHVVDRRTWQESRRLKDRVRRWMTTRRFNKAASQFLGVSQAAADYAAKHLDISDERMGVAYNSIDTAPFLQIADSETWSDDALPLRLGIAARIVPEKGHIFLFKAIRELRDRGLQINLQVTGDGPDRAMLETFVEENGLKDQIRFVGWVDSVTDFLSGIDVFMVPSVDSEGLPTTILEAMAAGRMVIATDIGGASEAITPDTGRIVPACDVKSLVDAIADVYSARRQAGMMTKAARQRIDAKFSMPQMLNTITEQYASMTKQDVAHKIGSQ